MFEVTNKISGGFREPAAYFINKLMLKVYLLKYKNIGFSKTMPQPQPLYCTSIRHYKGSL
jgi:hypothetical protein